MSASTTPPNDGNHNIGIIPEAGYVIARFQHPVEFLKMEPQNAFDIAGGLMAAAFEARNGRPPRKGIVEAMQLEVSDELRKKQRDTLVNRLLIIMPQINARSPLWQAQQIVDTIMAELV